MELELSELAGRIHSPCATRQSHSTIDASVRDSRSQSLWEIGKYRQIRLFRKYPTIKTFFSVIIMICAMSSSQ